MSETEPQFENDGNAALGAAFVSLTDLGMGVVDLFFGYSIFGPDTPLSVGLDLAFGSGTTDGLIFGNSF